MRRPLSPVDDGLDAEWLTPASVHVVRVLGHGRAAQAQLVDATMPDGRVVQCVEKVFAPGRLTRLIYRLAFQSPFAYQSNQDAIQSCFYRRRVAAAILAAADLEVDVAQPLYVRFDTELQAWVLAAQWVDGRGIKPAAANPNRITRLFQTITTRGRALHSRGDDEIDQLVGQMRQLERLLIDSGLTGSGWQVAPRALVSTANLLRVDDRYTIIDLESGIPAVLVPKYLLGGLARATLPPFDDLNADKLRSWFADHQRLLVFRLGPEAVDVLREDIDKLIDHLAAWKASELAIFRRPWRLLTRSGFDAYRAECLRRWQQNKTIDDATAAALGSKPLLACLIWLFGMLPGRLGRLISRWLGRQRTRQNVKRLIGDRSFRRRHWQVYRARSVDRWIKSGRISETQNTSGFRFFVHRVLYGITPVSFHRLLVDSGRRRDVATKLLLLMFSPRFQAHTGQRQIESAIDRWRKDKRLTDQQAAELTSDLSGDEIGVYIRGFGMHLALKAMAPIIIPAKVGGIAGFVASGNVWFLIPLLLTPLLRTIVTLASWLSSRHLGVSHREAMLTSWLPTLGSVAFPFQMFATRPELSTFLIRDAASRVGRKMPIYGGADSRTEIAFIRATDYLIAAMQWAASVSQRAGRRVATQRQSDIESQPTHLVLRRRSRLGRWLDLQTEQRISGFEAIDQQYVLAGSQRNAA